MGFEGFGKHQLASLLADMLSKEDKDWASKPDIKWNFTKFLVNRQGKVVARFEPTVDMNEVEAKIADLI
jgi:glutathione peroxidase